jgi:hypothetical protein
MSIRLRPNRTACIVPRKALVFDWLWRSAIRRQSSMGRGFGFLSEALTNG